MRRHIAAAAFAGLVGLMPVAPAAAQQDNTIGGAIIGGGIGAIIGGAATGEAGGAIAGGIIGAFGYASVFLFALLCVLSSLGITLVLARRESAAAGGDVGRRVGANAGPPRRRSRESRVRRDGEQQGRARASGLSARL